MHRCATGEHRGEGLGEGLAEVVAITAAIVADREPSWERLLPVLSSARDVWPHLCVAPWGANVVRNTWGPCVSESACLPDERCQKWFRFAVAVHDAAVWQRQATILAYERELYPMPCEVF